MRVHGIRARFEVSMADGNVMHKVGIIYLGLKFKKILPWSQNASSELEYGVSWPRKIHSTEKLWSTYSFIDFFFQLFFNTMSTAHFDYKLIPNYVRLAPRVPVKMIMYESGVAHSLSIQKCTINWNSVGNVEGYE